MTGGPVRVEDLLFIATNDPARSGRHGVGILEACRLPDKESWGQF